jgi:hypothetical protein
MLGARRAPLTAGCDWREQCTPFECEEAYYTAAIVATLSNFTQCCHGRALLYVPAGNTRALGDALSSKPSQHAIARSTRRGLRRDTPPMSAAGGVNARVVVVPDPTSNATAWRPIKDGRVISTRHDECGDGEDIADCCPQRESWRRQAQATRPPQDDSDVAAESSLNGVSRPAESRPPWRRLPRRTAVPTMLTSDPGGPLFCCFCNELHLNHPRHGHRRASTCCARPMQ